VFDNHQHPHLVGLAQLAGMTSGTTSPIAQGMGKQLVLLGAGPAHVLLMAHLAKHPLPHCNITLVTTVERWFDASQLPGFISGKKTQSQSSIGIEHLARQCKAQWFEHQVTQLDAQTRSVVLDDGRSLKYDWLSVDLEPQQSREAIDLALPGARANALFLHPHDAFCKLWPGVPELATTRALRVAVICGGDHATADFTHIFSAVELAFAIQQRLPGSAVTLITGGQRLAHNAPPALQKRLLRSLKRCNITVLADAAMAITSGDVQPGGGEIQLASGARLACDVPLLAQHSHAPTWVAQSGLKLDGNGWVATNGDGRANGQSSAFVACGSNGDDFNAWAQGQRLVRSLCKAVAGRVAESPASVALPSASPLEPSPASQHQGLHGLYFVNCGTAGSIACWGPSAFQGRWLGWVQQWLEAKRLKRFAPP
jgi:NADH dehydrogenase FAD-containing subunit